MLSSVSSSKNSNSDERQITRGGHIATGTSAARRKKNALPATLKSANTRQTLVAAAKRVFERIGYLDARVSDIVEEAQMAHGSFYTYFPSKREIFQEVVDQVSETIAAAVAPSADDVRGDYVGNLERANRRYLEVHHRDAAILALVEQVSTADPEIRSARVHSRHMHVDRIEKSIIGLQDRGLADTSVDAHITAGALVSMLSSFAHWTSLDSEEYEIDQVVHVLTDIWVRALGLRNPAPAAE